MVSVRSGVESTVGIIAGVARNRRTPVKYRFLTFFIDPDASVMERAAGVFRMGMLVAGGAAQIAEWTTQIVGQGKSIAQRHTAASAGDAEADTEASADRSQWTGSAQLTERYVDPEDPSTNLWFKQHGRIADYATLSDGDIQINLDDYETPGKYTVTADLDPVSFADVVHMPWAELTGAQREVIKLVHAIPSPAPGPVTDVVNWDAESRTLQVFPAGGKVELGGADLEGAIGSMPLRTEWLEELPELGSDIAHVELPDGVVKTALAQLAEFADGCQVRYDPTDGLTFSSPEASWSGTKLLATLRRWLLDGLASGVTFAVFKTQNKLKTETLEAEVSGLAADDTLQDRNGWLHVTKADGTDPITLGPDDLDGSLAPLLDALTGIDELTSPANLASEAVDALAAASISTAGRSFLFDAASEELVAFAQATVATTTLAARIVKVGLVEVVPAGDPLLDVVLEPITDANTVAVDALVWAGLTPAQGKTALKSLPIQPGATATIAGSHVLLWDGSTLTASATATAKKPLPEEVHRSKEVDLELRIKARDAGAIVGEMAAQGFGALGQEALRWFAEFKSVDYQGPTTSTLTYRELGGGGPKYFLKEVDCNSATLKTGFINQRWLYQWIKQVEWGKNFRRTGVIIMMDRSGIIPIRIIKLIDCFPTSWTGAALDANASGSQPIDTLVLSCGDIDVTNFRI